MNTPTKPITTDDTPRVTISAVESPPQFLAPFPPKLAAAFVKAQAKFQTVAQNREVEVRSEKGRYSFTYATLAALWEMARGPLAENGLGIMQIPTLKLRDNGKSEVHVTTCIIHESGECFEAHLTMPCTNTDPQKVGAVISYVKRYHIGALLGLASAGETDIDDAGQDARAVMELASRAASTPPPPAVPRKSKTELGLLAQAAKSVADIVELKKAAGNSNLPLPDMQEVTRAVLAAEKRVAAALKAETEAKAAADKKSSEEVPF